MGTGAGALLVGTLVVLLWLYAMYRQDEVSFEMLATDGSALHFLPKKDAFDQLHMVPSPDLDHSPHPPALPVS